MQEKARITSLMSSASLVIDRGGARADTWLVADPVAKLVLRARLPGAFSFDRTAEALARARRAGVAVGDLLPCALAGSWLVNNVVPSPIFARWLSPPANGYWRTLIPQLDVDFTADHTDAADERILANLKGLAVEGHGAGAMSKILALLVPQNVPLMPDAALSFALGTVPLPEAPDAQTADLASFMPMFNWFWRTVAAHREKLEAIAEEEAKQRPRPADPFLPAQVLDRIIWFDSIGYKNFTKGKMLEQGAYVWVKRKNGEAVEQAVVGVPIVREAPAAGLPEGPIDLDAEPSGPWKDQATKALDRAAGR